MKLALEETIALTDQNRRMTVILALSYSGRDEIVRTVRRLASEARELRLQPEDIDERMVADCLDSAGIPDPDLLIRTSGEMRISNFLLWQIAYTELWITPVLWPDFGPQHLYQAIAEYQRRDRRFGGV